MIANIMKAFNDKYDKDDQSLVLPDALKQITTDDANIEYLTSNTLLRSYLMREKNVVEDSSAIIFVNTNIKGLLYEEAEERA